MKRVVPFSTSEGGGLVASHRATKLVNPASQVSPEGNITVFTENIWYSREWILLLVADIGVRITVHLLGLLLG